MGGGRSISTLDLNGFIVLAGGGEVVRSACVLLLPFINVSVFCLLREGMGVPSSLFKTLGGLIIFLLGVLIVTESAEGGDWTTSDGNRCFFSSILRTCFVLPLNCLAMTLSYKDTPRFSRHLNEFTKLRRTMTRKLKCTPVR